MSYYMIKYAPVSISESGLIISKGMKILTLDSCYSDKVGFDSSKIIKYHCQEDLYEVDKNTFNEILQNTTKYNKQLKKELND